jgi:hypothetical protein
MHTPVLDGILGLLLARSLICQTGLIQQSPFVSAAGMW